MEERGLWITIQMECWVNGAVPSDLNELAKYLGITPNEIHRSFSQAQMSFLKKEGNELISPELEDQRKEYLERREKQRIGGIDGAKKKKAKQEAERLENEPSLPEGQPTGSLIQLKSNSVKSNQLTRKDVMSDGGKSWVEEYERAPDAAEMYLKASRG
jgi:hypothetical protein